MGTYHLPKELTVHETTDGMLWKSPFDAEAHQYNLDTPDSIQSEPDRPGYALLEK